MTPHEATAAKGDAYDALGRDHSLSSAEVRLGIILLQYYNPTKGYAWPSRETLVQDVGVSRSTITRAAQGLQAKGHFVIQWNKGRGCTNHYYPAFDCQQAKLKKGTSLHEKGSSLHTKGRTRAQKKAHPCGNTSLNNPLTKSSKKPSRQQPFDSPPEGVSRLPLNNKAESPLGTPSDDKHRENALHDAKEQAEDNDHQEVLDKTLRFLGSQLNSSRSSMKDAAYWKQHKIQKQAEQMNPSDLEDFWNNELAKDERSGERSQKLRETGASHE